MFFGLPLWKKWKELVCVSRKQNQTKPLCIGRFWKWIRWLQGEIGRLELYTKIEHSRNKESIGAKQCPVQWLVDYVMICMIASFIKNEKNQQ